MSKIGDLIIEEGEKLIKENPDMTWSEAMEIVTGFKDIEGGD